MYSRKNTFFMREYFKQFCPNGFTYKGLSESILGICLNDDCFFLGHQATKKALHKNIFTGVF